MLDKRQELILRLVIEEYIRSAEPVGSKYLAETFNLAFSSATIRNEMKVLEQEGFLRQPHVSAGRIPTEKSYIYYLQNMLTNGQHKIAGAPMRSALQEPTEVEQTLRELAKQLVQMSGETAIVATDPRWSYYAGVSNLFHKPDFHNVEVLQAIGEIFDQFDDVIRGLYKHLPETPQVLIGTQGPFGEHMATILVRYKLPGNHQGILGLVGPLRMDYARNIALVERAKEVITELYE